MREFGYLEGGDTGCKLVIFTFLDGAAIRTDDMHVGGRCTLQLILNKLRSELMSDHHARIHQ